MENCGVTRSHVAPDHALMTPDTHVIGPLAGWPQACGAVHISPRLGARFRQYSVSLEPGGGGPAASERLERFIYVLQGTIDVTRKGESRRTLTAGGFAFFPPGFRGNLGVQSAARLVVFEKTYQQLTGVARPQPILGQAESVTAEPFLGDPAARLQTLLPLDASFDMAINIFTYDPGATLPQVEIHVMEHGLLMLDGTGVYRLGNAWYPVGKGDVIWMAPYCPQWFAATGKEPARYLYYKDVNREPMASD